MCGNVNTAKNVTELKERKMQKQPERKKRK